MTREMEFLPAVKAACKAIDDKFGFDVKVLFIGEISVLSDYFIIATANNSNQLKAICDEVEKTLHKNGIRLMHSEGLTTAKWALLDFGSIIIHVFDKENREYYNLERIWGDAKPVDISV